MDVETTEETCRSKRCTKCGMTKEVSEFQKHRRKGDGLQTRCAGCRTGDQREWRRAHPETASAADRRHHLKRHFGVTTKDYDALFAAQDGVCVICRTACSSGRRLAVDHDHQTGAIRGLCCGACNQSLGKLKDNPTNFASALVYLHAHGRALTSSELTDLFAALQHDNAG
jgi:hypothetical protein